MAKRSPSLEVATEAALETLASQLHGKVAPGSSLKGTLVMCGGDVEVDITMVVRRRATVEVCSDHLTQAMIVFVMEPWRDNCQCSVKRREPWSLSKSSRGCRMRPTHVSVYRLYTGDVAYSFVCSAHAKLENGASIIALIKIPKQRLETARFEIKSRAELKLKLERMTPEERVVQDARDAKRPKAEIAALEAQIPAIGVLTNNRVFLCRCGASASMPDRPSSLAEIAEKPFRCTACGREGRVSRADSLAELFNTPDVPNAPEPVQHASGCPAPSSECACGATPIGTIDTLGVFRCRCGASHGRGTFNGLMGTKDARYRCLSCGRAGSARPVYTAINPGAFA